MDDKTLNRPFIYFLITSNNHYNPNLFERDTISYRFNRNIAIHTQSRYVIAHLPKCISELIVPWPLSVSIEGQNYITEYINIELLHE